MQKLLKKHPFLSGIGLRVAVGLLALLVLGGVLTGCNPASSSELTVREDFDMVEGGNLTEDTLEDLIKAIAKHNQAEYIRTQLIAARNGYDMTKAKDLADWNKNYDDKETANVGEALTYVHKVLDHYELASGSDKESYKDMNEADVENVLRAFQTAPDLDAGLKFLEKIQRWIGAAFAWMIHICGDNFLLGSFLFAVAVEILLFPIGLLQQKNSRKQAAMRPKEMAIRNKYAGRTDQATQQKVTAEIQELYQKEGYNPMTSGCLPLLVTMPVILVLYNVVIDPLKYVMGCSPNLSTALLTYASAPKAAGGLGFEIKRGSIEILSRLKESLSKDGSYELLDGMKNFMYFTTEAATNCFDKLAEVLPDAPSFTAFGIDFGRTIDWTMDTALLWIVPVLTFVAYFFSMKLTRKFSYQPTMNTDDKAAGCSNKLMDWSMPMVSVFVTFSVPGAIGVYWIFKSILSIGKQFLLSKIMPMPKFTEEDYKAAIKELQGKDKDKPKRRSGGNSNVRSLHHIDDEDYEPEAVRAAKAKERAEAEAAKKAEEEANAAGATHPLIERLTQKADRLFKKKDKTDKKDSSDESKDA